jgi:hypothetical protein
MLTPDQLLLGDIFDEQFFPNMTEEQFHRYPSEKCCKDENPIPRWRKTSSVY